MTFKAKPKKCWKVINVWEYEVKLAVVDIKNKLTMYHYFIVFDFKSVLDKVNKSTDKISNFADRNFNVSVTITYLRNKPVLKLGIPDS